MHCKTNARRTRARRYTRDGGARETAKAPFRHREPTMTTAMKLSRTEARRNVSGVLCLTNESEERQLGVRRNARNRQRKTNTPRTRVRRYVRNGSAKETAKVSVRHCAQTMTIARNVIKTEARGHASGELRSTNDSDEHQAGVRRNAHKRQRKTNAPRTRVRRYVRDGSAKENARTSVRHCTHIMNNARNASRTGAPRHDCVVLRTTSESEEHTAGVRRNARRQQRKTHVPRTEVRQYARNGNGNVKETAKASVQHCTQIP